MPGTMAFVRRSAESMWSVHRSATGGQDDPLGPTGRPRHLEQLLPEVHLGEVHLQVLGVRQRHEPVRVLVGHGPERESHRADSAFRESGGRWRGSGRCIRGASSCGKYRSIHRVYAHWSHLVRAHSRIHKVVGQLGAYKTKGRDMTPDEVNEVDRQTARLSESLGERHGMVTSCDLDGLLTAVVISGVSAWRLEGFYDSRDSLWLTHPRGDDGQGYVFLDVFVARPDVFSVDQHIIASDPDHGRRQRESGNKINPNLARLTAYGGVHGRTFTDKYPFGTVHYVIALLERSGRSPSIGLEKLIAPGLTVMDLLMRADGAADNTKNFPRNANVWWDWLSEIGGDLTRDIARSARAIARSDGGFTSKKAHLERLFRGLGCSTSDANFAAALRDESLVVKSIVRQFWSWLDCDHPPDLGHFERYTGQHLRMRPDSADTREALRRRDLFTYAYTNMNAGGFSMTLLDTAAESLLGPYDVSE